MMPISAALDAAFGEAADEIVNWSASVISSARDGNWRAI